MKDIILLLTIIWLSGCVNQQLTLKQDKILFKYKDYKIDTSHPAQGYNERVRFLVFHYTALDDNESLQLLTTSEVSAHYLIPSYSLHNKGKRVILQLVAENKRAWHAGISEWAGRTNLNDTSIGIEIVNNGFYEGLTGKIWSPYHKKQVLLLAHLARDIITRYQILPENVVGHSDIAPLRKYDPGPLFPWQWLAQQGIGAWPDTATVTKYLQGKHRWSAGNIVIIQRALANYGYTIPQTGEEDDNTRRVISAFQMHFRPSNINGVADKETEAIARALVEKYHIKTQKEDHN